MEFGGFEKTENGYKLRCDSKFLSFVLKWYSRRIEKKFKKIYAISPDSQLNVVAELNFALHDGSKGECQCEEC